MSYKVGQYITFKRNDVFHKAKIVGYRAELDMFYVLLDSGCEVIVMPYEIVTPYNPLDDLLDAIEKFEDKEKMDYTFLPIYNPDLTKVRTIYYSRLPKSVFFNDKKKATTLMFPNQKATVVKCGDGDEYSRRVGFLEAYFQATCGLSKTKAKKYLQEIVKDKEK